jgi:predicted PurR-regulated permease PerM
LLFLIGLIGGVEIFGGVGILAGPLAMALFASVMRIYRREIVDPLRRDDPTERLEDVLDDAAPCAPTRDRAG